MDAPASRLLLACASWDVTPARSERVRSAATNVDWAEWLALVRQHRLAPHAKRQLDAAGVEMPAVAGLALDDATRGVAVSSLRRAAQLAALHRDLSGAGVRMLAYKGPALSLSAYGELGARQSFDLDVVVHPDDLPHARRALLGAGYKSRYRMSAAQERVLQGGFGHFVVVRRADEAPVELHWRFSRAIYPWTLPLSDVFARAVTVNVGGEQIAVACAADDVLLQCMHGARHEWDTLEWLVAMEGTARRAAVSAAELLATATQHSSRRAFLLAALLLRDVLQSDLFPPELAITAQADTTVRDLAVEIGARFVDPRATRARSDRRFALPLMDHGRDRRAYLLRTIFEPTLREWEWIRLPGFLLPLYYVIRPVRLVAAAMAGARARGARED